MAEGRPGPGDRAAGSHRSGSRRGLVMFSKPLPRFVIAKRLANGTGFYFHLPALYRKLGCSIPNEALGTDYVVACGENGDGGRAAGLNGLFDEWNSARKGGQVTTSSV